MGLLDPGLRPVALDARQAGAARLAAPARCPFRILAKTGSRDRVTAIGYAQRHNIG